MKTEKSLCRIAGVVLILGMILPFSMGSASARGESSLSTSEIITPENIQNLKLITWMGQGTFTGEIALQPDGSLIAAATGSGITLFDRKKRAQTGFIPLGLEPTALAISPDGETLAVVYGFPTGQMVRDTVSGSEYPEKRQQINFYTLPDGKPIRSSIQDLKECGQSNILAAAFTPDGTGLLFEKKYGGSNSARLFCVVSVADGRIVRVNPLPEKAYSDISPAGDYAATLQWDQTKETASLSVLRSTDFSQVVKMDFPAQSLPQIKFANSGEAVMVSNLSGTSDSQISTDTIYSLPEGKLIYNGSLPGQEDSVMSLDVNLERNLLAMGTQQGRINVLNLDSKTNLNSFGPLTALNYNQVENPGGINSSEMPVYVRKVAFCDNGTSLVASEYYTTLGQAGGIRVYGIENKAEIVRFSGSVLGSSENNNGFAFSPDSHEVALGGSLDGKVKLYQIPDGKLRITLQGHTATVNEVQYSPDGRIIATGSDDQDIRLWDAISGKLQRILTGHTSRITRLAFSGDGKLLISGADDNTIRVWNVAEGSLKETRQLGDENWRVELLAFLPDGKSVIYRITKYPSPYIGFIQKQILWNMQSGQETPIGGSNIWLMTISQDGQFFTAYGVGKNIGQIKPDGTIEITDEFRSPYGNGALVSAAISPDHQLLISGNGFGLHAWKLDSAGKTQFIGLTATSEPIPNYGQSYQFSPDGRYLAFSNSGALYLLGIQGE